MRLFYFFIFLMGLATLFWYKNPLPYFFKQSDSIRVGIGSSYPPYVVVDETSAYTGFDVELAHLIGKELGKQIELVDLGNMHSLWVGLDRGTVDALMWGLSMTPERRNAFHMLSYFDKESPTLPLVFWEKIPEHIKSLDDIVEAQPLIMIEPGSLQARTAREYQLSNIVAYDSAPSMIAALSYKKADAAFLDPELYLFYKKKMPELISFDIQLPASIDFNSVGIAFAKENKKMIQTFSTALKNIEKRGELKALRKKWGLESE